MAAALLAILCVYDYTDTLGSLLYQAVRYEPGRLPRFSQRRPDGRGGWINNLDGVPRVLYRLPEVIAAARAGAVVYVVEGEKDVHAAERLGLVATCCAGGAGSWRPEFAEWLRGCREVVIVADRDPAGTRYARSVSASLAGVAPWRAVRSGIGNDLSDHVGAGLGFDALVPFELPRESRGIARASRSRKIRGDGLARLDREGDPLKLIDPPAYVERLTGRRANRHGKTPCMLPGHEDSAADGGSFHVYPTAEEGWFCFGACNHGGDLYDLARALWGDDTSFTRMRRRLLEIFLGGGRV